MLTHVVVKECDCNYVTEGKFQTWPLQCKILGFIPDYTILYIGVLMCGIPKLEPYYHMRTHSNLKLMI
jgi:hypothetical protein